MARRLPPARPPWTRRDDLEDMLRARGTVAFADTVSGSASEHDDTAWWAALGEWREVVGVSVDEGLAAWPYPWADEDTLAPWLRGLG